MRYLREKEVRNCAAGVARSTLQRWERDGLFPKRVKLGPGDRGVVGWTDSDINEWLELGPDEWKARHENNGNDAA